VKSVHLIGFITKKPSGLSLRGFTRGR